MKKKTGSIILVMAMTLTICACTEKADNTKENISIESIEELPVLENKEDILIEENVIEGYKLMDGRELPVTITMGIESILRGEEAYNELYKQDAGIEKPNENEEYIIVTFHISYDEGEIEELVMLENRASMEGAGLYFALSNSKSNAYDMTSYLPNSIYQVSLAQGQSAQGAVAFLQEKGNTEPLYFVGFGKITEFNINL